MHSSSSSVLVAYDGRCPATLRAATALARVLGLDLTIAVAYRYEPVALSARALPSEGNARRFEEAQALALRTAAGIHGIGVHTCVVPAQGVAEALRDVAVELDVTAIVMGPDLQGDVTRRLSASAPCPVLTAPEEPRLVSDAYREIGVAYDGSIGSRFALIAATDLGIRSGARVHIVAVAPDERAAVAARLHADQAAVEMDGVQTVVDVRLGNVNRALRAASARLDLMICGSRGRGKLLGNLLGSVSADLLELPNCPVLVVPPAVRRRGATALGLGTAAAA
jgi:nucleotide-binding universal stress UspA family protein